MKKLLIAAITTLVLMIVVTIVALAASKSKNEDISDNELQVTVQIYTLDMLNCGDYLDPYESERIEAALLESGYFNNEVPLSYGEQDDLRTACVEFNIPYTLALAIIEHETNFRNIMGDNGNSYGYMQIQLKWHKGRMDEIGATDLLVPYDNFRTGCSLLSDLLSQYNLQDALSCYNSGGPGMTQYANSVIAKMENWKKIIND